LCLILDEFYQDINAIYVSSTDGQGFDTLEPAIEKAREEYLKVFLPDLQKLKMKNPQGKKRIEDELKKLNEQANLDKEAENKKNQFGFGPQISVSGGGGGMASMGPLNSAFKNSKAQKPPKDSMIEEVKDSKLEQEVVIKNMQDKIEKMDISSPL